MNAFFFLLILATGVVTISTDISEQRIKNKHLSIILSIAAILYYLFISLGKLTMSLALIVNPLVGLIIGFIFYSARLWKAGDAKLFFTYCFLLPLNKYSAILPLSCFGLFINTFLASFTLMFFFSLYSIIAKGKELFKKLVSLQAVLYFGKILIITSGVLWIIQPLISLLPLKNNVFLNFTLIFAGYSLIYKFINKIKHLSILISLFAVGLGLRYIAMPEFFLLTNISKYLKSVLGYATCFYMIINVMETKEAKLVRVPFSPFLFLGALLSQTNLLLWLIKFIIDIRY